MVMVFMLILLQPFSDFCSLFFRYLIEHAANVAAVNNDGELPLDIAESDEMEELLQEHIIAKGNIFSVSHLKNNKPICPNMSPPFLFFFQKLIVKWQEVRKNA